MKNFKNTNLSNFFNRTRPEEENNLANRIPENATGFLPETMRTAIHMENQDRQLDEIFEKLLTLLRSIFEKITPSFKL